MSRFSSMYHDTIVPELMKKFGYKTTMQVPRITKITLMFGIILLLSSDFILKK